MKLRNRSPLFPAARFSSLLSLCSVTFVVLTAGHAIAQDTWDGGAGTGNWADNDNWVDGSAPPANATSGLLSFGGNVQNTMTNNIVGITTSGIRFTSNGLGPNNTAFNLSGNSITLDTQNNAVQTTAIGAGGTSITDTLGLNLNSTGIRQFNIGLGHDLIFSGALSGTGASLSKGGLGTLTVSGSNSYTGLTYVDSGTLKLGAADVLPGTTLEMKRGSTSDSNPVLDLNGFSDTIGGITFGHATTTASNAGGQPSIINTGASSAVLTLGGSISYRAGSAGFLNGQASISANLATGNAVRSIVVGDGSGANDLVVSGVLSGSGTITKQGAGVLMLSGANTYSGQLNVETGTVKLGAGNTLPDATTNIVQLGVNASTAGVVLDINGFSDTVGPLRLNGATGGSPTAAGLTHSIIDSAGGGVLTLGNSFNVYAGGANQYGQATISAGLNTGASARNFNVENSTAAAVDLLISGVIGGVGNGFNMAGAGTVALSNANTYSGDTRTGSGVLLLQNNLALQNSALDGAGSTTGTVSLASGITTPTIGGLKGSRSLSTVITSGYGSVTSLTLNPISGSVVYTGSIADGAAGMALTKKGAGGQVFTGANSYTGKTTVEAGTLRFGRENSLYGGASASWTAANINVKSAATLALNVDSAGTSGFDSASLAILLTNISVANNSGEGLQAGAILGFETSIATGDSFTQGNAIADSTGASGGAIGLIKLGTGSLVLDKANTYTGATTVNEGKLVVTNSIGSSAVTVGGVGAILASDDAATIGSTLTVKNGAILAVGDAANATTATATVTGATTFNNGSIFSWDINAAGTSHDKLVTASLAGDVAAGYAVFRIVAADASFADSFWDSNQTWTDIFTTDGSAAIANWATLFGNSVSVVNSSFTTITPVDGAFSISGSTLTWTAVPEPSSALAGLLLSAGLLRRRRA